MSWLMVVCKLCINNAKITNVSRKELVCLNNFESQVLATCCITQMNLVMCHAFELR